MVEIGLACEMPGTIRAYVLLEEMISIFLVVGMPPHALTITASLTQHLMICMFVMSLQIIIACPIETAFALVVALGELEVLRFRPFIRKRSVAAETIRGRVPGAAIGGDAVGVRHHCNRLLIIRTIRVSTGIEERRVWGRATTTLECFQL